MSNPDDGQNAPIAKSSSKPPKLASVDTRNPPWYRLLIKSGQAFKPNLANALTFLRHAEEWSERLRYDALALRIELRKAPPSPTWPKFTGEWIPRPWDDQDDRLLAEWLQRLKIDVKVGLAADAAETVAREHRYHPIENYLEGLQWDGQPRVHRWLTDYFGVEPSPYHEAVGMRWLLSAVARAMQPGCKVDCMLILEGAQGAGKGRSLEALVPVRAWFSDDVKEFGSLESARQLAGKWIIESSELEGIKGTSGKKAINEGVKAFLSRSIDNYRAPYGRRAQDHPRQCIFAGTTNQSEIFTDATGNRRFWPVKCETARPDELYKIRDQLWAETLVLYKQGMKWWLDTPELLALARTAQDDRFEVDPLEPDVAEFLEKEEFVILADVACYVFNKKVHELTATDQDRTIRMLTRLGWEKGRSKSGPMRDKRGYVKGKMAENGQVVGPEVEPNGP